MSECDATHYPISEFKSGGLWVCSGCGKRDAWSDSWSYFGALGCRKCGNEPAIEFVACSDACRKKHASGKRHESLTKLDAEIARAKAHADSSQQHLRALEMKRARMEKR